LWQALRLKCRELSALVCRAGRPGEAAVYVLDYLPAQFEYTIELLLGRQRLRAVDGPGDGSRGADSA
jgi:hypothetical protein